MIFGQLNGTQCMCLCHQKEASKINAVPWSSQAIWDLFKVQGKHCCSFHNFSHWTSQISLHPGGSSKREGHKISFVLGVSNCCVWQVRWWGSCNEVPAAELFSNQIISSWLLHWNKQVLLKPHQGFYAAEGLGIKDRKGRYNLKEMLSRKHLWFASFLLSPVA